MTFVQYSKQIAERIRHVLQKDRRKFEYDEAEGVFTFTLPLHDLSIESLQYYIFVHEDRYILYAHPPFRADLNDRRNKWQLAMFLLKANYVLYDGSFQLNYRNGLIRYRIYHQCDGHIPSEENIREAIQISAYAYETFGCGIAGILRFSMTADYAFDLCENEQLKLALFSSDDTSAQQDTGAATEADSEEEETESDKIAAQIEELFEALRGSPFEDDTDTSDAADNGTDDENLDTHLFDE